MRTIKIEQKQSFIPVIIGDLEFVFHFSDENIEKFETEVQAFALQLTAIETSNDSKSVPMAREILKKGMDSMLGEGSFDKVYEQVPSSIVIAGYFAQIVLQLKDAIADFGSDQINTAEKYKKNGRGNYNKGNNKNSQRNRQHNNRR